ncbi:toll/interleukin-1 receptor domain-containing protein [Catenulispora pinisilvae]|uniref:toll/interleukin-1 receptor domain-containing protein n=1 Tax=Catenulispora pinisilvae TaxID=2705253 RepID=UPI001890C1F4|nr:toll/interleukin-1 receptor domain-containing protein [Catenulispora pinisilvae]
MTAGAEAAPQPADQWDVFISYAREDFKEAKGLQDALLKYVKEDGSTPRVYLDVSRSGTPAGVDWQSYLEEALRHSRYIVPLYSPTYFEKSVCEWELHEAYRLSVVQPDTELIPVLIHSGAVEKVPFVVHGINWIATTQPDWFDVLREATKLRTAAIRRILGWPGPAPEAVAGRTLEPVRVSLSLTDGLREAAAGVSVTLSAEPDTAGLTGTLTVDADRGEAVFDDLVLHTATDEVRLVATAAGCERAVSESFPVRSIEVRPPVGAQGPGVLVARGRPVFFPDGRALAVLDDSTLTVYTDRYQSAGSAELKGRPRLWARGRRLLAVADWAGRVLLASPDGEIRTWDIPAHDGACFSVPGALAFDGDALYVGTWAGEVWSVPLGGEAAQTVLKHPSGVQVLTADRGRFLVGGLDGTLAHVMDGRVVAERRLEPVLLGAALVNGFGLIVGEQFVYRLDLAKDQLLRVKQPVTGIAGVLPGSDLTAIVDAEGRFVCFDTELAVRVGFRTVPGARPVDVAEGGRLLVLEHPDGSHSLVREGRATSVSRHPFAVSPDGRRAAASDGSRLVVLPIGELTEGDGVSEEVGDRG